VKKDCRELFLITRLGLAAAIVEAAELLEGLGVVADALSGIADRSPKTRFKPAIDEMLKCSRRAAAACWE
jgi:hypothetical protein